MGDDVLVDRYRRLALLGGGSMGEVWLADDLWLHRQVAVKMLRVDPSAGDDPAAVDRMLRTARLPRSCIIRMWWRSSTWSLRPASPVW